MDPRFGTALNLVWSTLLAYWLWSARRVKSPVQMEPLSKRFVAYWLPLILALVLLGPGEWFAGCPLREQFVPHSIAFQSMGLFLCIASVAIACWSRHLLGENWSATVQLKDNHQLITRGPYGLIRHPIYTGLLLLFLGNAVLVGDWRGLVAVAIVFASFWRKLRLEERWLSELFGEVYRQYKGRTSALIPGLL
ncbi:methyltransferase family protein [Dyella telluris]|uniref:Isoprenylcysteine carboxylmethyltransferase family protein n=1 Tax=Dyella telluris TaxID=2763498 RepID=A0A7G8Q653_9GAMM|nr:isoprenylcysteine carboxylmethyltransferase family protein [Dyella telluris]QNK02261.1 isoprenylcysteine carboxylmethyltransferase family protein [Dyella telluris]